MASDPIDILIGIFLWVLLFAFIRHAWNSERVRHQKPKPFCLSLDVGKRCNAPNNADRIGRWHLKGGMLKSQQEKEYGGAFCCWVCEKLPPLKDFETGRQLPGRCECIDYWRRFTPSAAAFSRNEKPKAHTQNHAASLHSRDVSVVPFTKAESERLSQRKKGTNRNAKKTDTG